MFTENKYKVIYENFVDERKQKRIRKLSNNTPYEEHHIIPRSLGGSDNSNNLVKLTPREHYFAHLLLVKITSGADQIKMSQALRFMSGITKSKRVINSKQYDLAKRLCYRTMQSAGKNYQPEKELQDEILTTIVDFDKVLERGVCKVCGIRPRSINYYKKGQPYYRSKCDVCTLGKNPYKVPAWIKQGYAKLNSCELCNFNAKFTEQLTVIQEHKKYKTICLNCQAGLVMTTRLSPLSPMPDN